MQRTLVGFLVDDTLYSPTGMQISPSRAVTPRAERRRANPVEEPMLDPVDEVASLLARVIRLAQNINPNDQRRVRDLVHAASSTLSASTILPRDDQRLFERALRKA